MNRRIRWTASVLAIAALLFAPLAMSFRACPHADGAAPALEGPPAGADTQSGMSPCERHCNQPQLSVDPVKPTPTWAFVAALALRVPTLERIASLSSTPRIAAFLADPSPPPKRSTVLRI